MAVPGGYWGKILRVNLSTNGVSVDEPDEEFYRKYLGGAGFIAYYLWKELKQGVDPLGPDNKLIFANGPLSGLMLPGSGRNGVGAKSPLTGGFAKAEVGGHWGAELKRAGYDAIIVEGKAQKPVYIWIQDGDVQIKDAGHLWGKNTKESQEAIKAELNDSKVQVAGIGPAGENLVRFSCVMNGLFDAAGRGGTGAVMGSKNLKAIAVRGHKLPAVANPEKVTELRQWMLANMQLVKGMREFGTGAEMTGGETTGNLPVRNFRDGLFPSVNNISAKTVKDTIRIAMDGCFGCPVRCKKVIQAQAPHAIDPAYGGPEYETLAALGSDCGVDDLNAVGKGNELCGAYALDTISAGGVIAFAMECFEHGLITTKDTNGLELKFGDKEAMLKLIEMITRREGIGDLLAEGSLRAARKIGKGAIEYAMQVKGLEPGMHEPRLKPSIGLGYMVAPHGADHCCNMHDPAYVTPGQIKDLRPLGILKPLPADEMSPRKVVLFRTIMMKRVIGDSLVLCSFLPYSFEQVANVTAGVTGWDMGIMEQLRVAERALTLARLFNIREGFSAADDALPKRYYQPKTDGALSNKPLDPAKMERAKRYYYSLMGWDSNTGVPTSERLEDLEIA